MQMTKNNSLILVVEDEDNLRLAVTDNLESEGYDVISTRTAKKANEYVEKFDIDLIVLDIMLPDNDGISLCRGWRAAGLKAMVLMLTALDQEESVVSAFKAGADDYIVKPYPLQVFLLRVNALLRRIEKQSLNPAAELPPLAGFTIDTDARQVLCSEGQEILLTKQEYELLIFFLKNSNSALTYAMILDEVWGENVIVVQGAIRNTVSSLRKKLQADEVCSSWRIVTLRGIGYRLEIS